MRRSLEAEVSIIETRKRKKEKNISFVFEVSK